MDRTWMSRPEMKRYETDGCFFPVVSRASISTQSACMQSSVTHSRNQVCVEDRLQGACSAVVFFFLPRFKTLACCQRQLLLSSHDQRYLPGVNTDLNPLEKVLSEMLALSQRGGRSMSQPFMLGTFDSSFQGNDFGQL